MPIDLFKFDNLIKDLEGIFGKIATTQKERDDKMKYYFEALSDCNYGALKKAINYIISHRSKRFFPLPAEIKEACDQYLQESPMAKVNELNEYSCDECNSTGFMLEDYEFTEKQYTMAVCCGCKKGQIMRQSAEHVISKRNQGKPLF